MIALKGPQGVYVNEEDFTRASRHRISHPTESIAEQADTYGRKWSKQFEVPGFNETEDFRMVAVKRSGQHVLTD